MHMVSYREFPENCNRKQVLDDIVREAEREGDGYSGGVKWHDEVMPLANREAAEKWIKDHDKGWYDDHAVRFYDYSKAKETKKIVDLQVRVDASNKRLADFQNEHSIRKHKAEFVGCASCGSRLARKLLRGECCPVCGSDLRSKSVLEKLENIKNTRERLIQMIKDEKEKQTENRRVFWLVKYEYHC